MIQIGALRGLIRRRVLVNFRVDPKVMARRLPDPFRPLLVGGAAIAGICLIRLEQIRPPFAPRAFGIRSENAAHRVAVKWMDSSGREIEGVYVLRRDTDSVWNHIAGGRLFPGRHHLAKFQVCDDCRRIQIRMDSDDGSADLAISARTGEGLREESRFPSLAQARLFFENGKIGYSPSQQGQRFDGLELDTEPWVLMPLHVESLSARYFDDSAAFPAGSIAFDSALILRDVEHTWRTLDRLDLRAS